MNLFKKSVKRPPEDFQYPPLSAEEFEEIAFDSFGKELKAAGFSCVGPRRWVRSQKPLIRELFLLQALKGASYGPVWGFSLDFVPHVTKSGVRWHRTNRSARLDLRYDPLDYRNTEAWTVSRFAGRLQVREGTKQLAANALPLSYSFFELVQTIQDLLSVFECQRKRDSIRFSFYNYTQQPLAYAFTMAAMGQAETASEMLNNYIYQYNVPEFAAEKLNSMIQELRANRTDESRAAFE